VDDVAPIYGDDSDGVARGLQALSAVLEREMDSKGAPRVDSGASPCYCRDR
jgi:hypothetical protein